MVPQKHMLPRNRVEVSCLLVLRKQSVASTVT